MGNPVNRLAGLLGLAMLGAIAYQLVLQQITLVAAGTRAAATLLAVIAVRRIGAFGMRALAGSMERQAATPQRRASDRTEEPANS